MAATNIGKLNTKEKLQSVLPLTSKEVPRSLFTSLVVPPDKGGGMEIFMKKRYRYANAIEGDYSQKRIDKDDFHGYVCYIKIKNIREPFIVNNGMCDICIIDDN